MNNIRDLHIQKDIFPLLDFTLNSYARDELINILNKPLSSVDEILLRQSILKGIIQNYTLFDNYAYSKRDLSDVYNFFRNFSNIETSKKVFAIKLLFFQKERHQTRGVYNQLVLLLHKLAEYFKAINLLSFPESYKAELKGVSAFLEGFNLTHYEKLIKKNKIKTRHIIELTEIISESVKKNEHTLFWSRFFLFEAYLSISKAIIKNHFTFPLFNNSRFYFQELYHPLIKQPVKNDFEANSNVILLTGPNMSGKSTFLKAIGIVVYLGHIGLGVPALNVTKPYFDNISIAINLNDDIERGYSHFMFEIKNLKETIINASDNKKCFAVFDELFRGTNMEDAMDVSAATIKGLIQFKNSVFVISTHLHQLKNLEDVKSEKVASHYFDCALINDAPVFNYRLKKGWSDLKVGKILFENEGLNRLLHPE